MAETKNKGAAADSEKLAERQDEIGAEIRGDKVDPKVASLDEEFQRNWEKQQREAYPQLYAKADEYRKNAEEQDKQGAGVPAALEPGHDASVSEELEKDAEKSGETAGSDNRAPHDTTPAQPAVPHVA